jgi:transglutaminase-like putative cysteine protease
MIMRMMRATRSFGGGGGFSEEVQLGSLSAMKFGENGQKTALRIFSKRSPGYLRGRVYVDYADGKWDAARKNLRLEAAQVDDLPPTPPPPGMRPFELRTTSETDLEHFDVWPTPTILEGMFIPAESTHLRAPVGIIDMDDHGAIDSIELLSGANYMPYSPLTPVPRTNIVNRAQLTAVPQRVRTALAAISADIFSGCVTDADKIARVSDHFTENYTYRIGISVPPGQDPVVFFMKAGPPAHCEFFAAATAILLRLEGIPTRYVTGFVAGDRNRYGDYWVARYRNAHAWVEAYDSDRGWVQVESTPADGLPTAAATKRSALLDYLRFKITELRIMLRLGGWRGMLTWLAQIGHDLWRAFISGSLLGILLKLILLGFLGRAVWRRRESFTPSRMSGPSPHADLHKLLAAVDAAMKRHDLVRAPAETYHQFAQRIAKSDIEPTARDTASQWYRDYARARYRGRTTAAEIGQLAETASEQ